MRFRGHPVHTSLYDPDGTFPEFVEPRRPHPPARPVGRPAGPSPPGPPVARPGLFEAQRRGRGDRVLVQRLGPRSLHHRSQGRLLPHAGPLALPIRSLPGRSVQGLGRRGVAHLPLAPTVGPPRRGLRQPVSGQLPCRPPAGVGSVRHRCRSGAPARRRRPPGRPGGRPRHRARVRPLRLEAAPLQERRSGHRRLRAAPGTATGGRGERTAGRPDHLDLPTERDRARSGQ